MPPVSKSRLGLGTAYGLQDPVVSTRGDIEGGYQTNIGLIDTDIEQKKQQLEEQRARYTEIDPNDVSLSQAAGAGLLTLIPTIIGKAFGGNAGAAAGASRGTLSAEVTFQDATLSPSCGARKRISVCCWMIWSHVASTNRIACLQAVLNIGCCFDKIMRICVYAAMDMSWASSMAAAMPNFNIKNVSLRKKTPDSNKYSSNSMEKDIPLRNCFAAQRIRTVR